MSAWPRVLSNLADTTPKVSRGHFRRASLFLSLSCGCLTGSASAWSQKNLTFQPEVVHRIIATATLDALPLPLRDSFQAKRVLLLHDVAAADSLEQIHARNKHGTVWLDYSAPENADPAARLNAARDFPMDREASKTKGYRAEVFGDLPFVLQDHVHRLTQAMRAARWETVREQSLHILRFSAFVGFPSQLTRDAQSGDAYLAELWLVDQIRPRLEYEVRVFPGRFQRASDTGTLILAALRDGHASYFQMRALIADAQRDAGITDSRVRVDIILPDDGPSVREFRRIYAERAGSLMCEQFKNAALLAANLIGTAWMDAGSPEVPMDTFAPRTEDKPGDSAKPDGADKSGVAAGDQKKSAAAGAVDLVADKFMGSSGSETYHRSSCQHAARIKPENTIRFTSLEEAQRAGRKACQTCKPDSK